MSIAAPEAPTKDAVDLADLDGLDDAQEHVVCDVCNGGRASFAPHDLVKIVCGQTILAGLAEGDKTCKPCAEAYETQTCPIHGCFR